MEKSWVAVSRRSESCVPVVACYEVLLDALARAKHSKHKVLYAIPDTVLYSHTGVRWYTNSTDGNGVMRQPPHIVTSDAIYQSMCCNATTDIVAVWLCDRRDAKGMLVSVEYLTPKSLSAMLAMPGRLEGVLQRFVVPRYLHNHHNCNSEVILHYDVSEKEATVERRFTRRNLAHTTLHPTLRGTVHPSVVASGKLSVSSLPFAPQDVDRSLGFEVVECATFTERAISLCESVCRALVGNRKSDRVHETRRPSFLKLVVKLPAEGDMIWVLGLAGLRFPADHNNPDISFELFHAPTPEDVDEECLCTDTSEFELMPVTSTIYGRGPTVVPPVEQRPPDAPACESAPILTERHSVSPHGPPGTLLCPNCGLEMEKDAFVLTPYRSILHWVDSRSREARDFLAAAIPLADSSSGKRPATARVASSEKVLREIGDEAPCFLHGHEWSEIPPVLKRLNINLGHLRHRAVWLDRSVRLCQGCANVFQGKSVEKNEKTDSAAPLPRIDEPPTCLRSDVIDGMVVSELQHQHRAMRRAERVKHEMRRVIQRLRDKVAAGTSQEAEKLRLESALEELEPAKDAVAGPAPDVSLAVMLCNSLRSAMEKVCAEKKDPILVPSATTVRPTGYEASFPQPVVLVDPRGLDDPGMKEESLRRATNLAARRKSYRALSGVAEVYKQLTPAELLLMMEVCGADHKSADQQELPHS